MVKVGTQFEVTVNREALEVAVREGQIKVALDDQQAFASAAQGQGEVLHYDAQGNQSRATLTTTDTKRWQWTQLSRPNFDLSTGTTYYDYLRWAARERGLTLKFDGEMAEHFAKSPGKGQFDASDVQIEQALRANNLDRLPAAGHVLLVGRQ